MFEIDELLMQIEEEVVSGKKGLFDGSVKVNGDRIFAIVEKIRESLPDVISEAKYIINTSEKRRMEDMRRAQNLIINAEQQAGEILSEHYLIEEAQKEADLIRQQAHDYKNRLYVETRHEIYRLLKDAESNLIEALGTIVDARDNI